MALPVHCSGVLFLKLAVRYQGQTPTKRTLIIKGDFHRISTGRISGRVPLCLRRRENPRVSGEGNFVVPNLTAEDRGAAKSGGPLVHRRPVASTCVHLCSDRSR